MCDFQKTRQLNHVVALLLDARESSRMAPEVARLLAKELGFDSKWEADQVEKYQALALRYVLN